MKITENIQPITVGVVGVGGWGKNLVRVFDNLPGAELRYVCDIDQRVLTRISVWHPHARVTEDFKALLDDPDLAAMIVASTASSHYSVTKAALEAGKDVFVEKPFVLKRIEAEELIRCAQENNRILMVGHLLEYHPVVERLRQMIADGELGQIYYVYSQRINLGTVRHDENALWNFAPHDISSIAYMLGRKPTEVAAHGQSYIRDGVEDVVFMTLKFGTKAMAHIHVSWLDPNKTRRITVVGSKKMAVFDDGETSEKLRVYDKGVQLNPEYESFAEYVGLRFGNITIPYIQPAEPLHLECQHFLDCVRNRVQPRTDAWDGLMVVSVLEGADQSLKRAGMPVQLHWKTDSPATVTLAKSR